MQNSLFVRLVPLSHVSLATAAFINLTLFLSACFEVASLAGYELNIAGASVASERCDFRV